ncbi:ATPase, T2SS/T4P/T4SS family [Limnobacter humi]|uniref:ATPase, T2SS/T4P/T4SS family n=1 Tax=Limnobacter humi TaxID=1778671 RepID=A0ABT1WF18_9BURK|nr:ATPase, T2SS/T4P/T4SS family [Limnobacter humi]MCQ8895029.1 ATPase, T2SS/T4P/T4SS family [Limnobacter humi]
MNTPVKASVKVPPSMVPRADGPVVINALSELPFYTSVLSGRTGSHLVLLPAAVESHLVIIETGIKRALVLFNPDSPVPLAPFIAQARGRLIANKFQLDGKDQPCSLSVLEHLTELARSNEVDLEGLEDSNFSQSQAKEIFESWVNAAVREKATDIHVRVTNNVAQVHLRVDGDLEPLRDGQNGIYTPLQAERAMAWAYNNASGKGSNSESQFSTTENLYCMIEPREIAGQRVALRYQSIRGWSGTKLVCRLLYVDVDSPTLSYEQLGYARSQIQELKNASNTPSGLIIFSGVTGSGKTTSLKTFIETHPHLEADAFYSLEDPVEYPLKGVHQIPIQRDLIDRQASMAKFSEVIAGLMRADPGCVMMGEIRDSASAMAAQQIVETGHMACATVHAHLISGIVPRLTNDEIGMSREVLTNPNMLTLLVYQALVPKLCTNCRINGSVYSRVYADSEHVYDILSLAEQRFGLTRDRFFFKNPRGCGRCRGRGTTGLTVVSEVYSPDTEWLKLIRESKDYDAMRYFRSKSNGQFDSPDMTGKTVFEHSLYKALMGTVDLRVCERFDSFHRFEVLS